MFTSKEYRSIARAKLRGAWGSSILVTFLAGLLGGFGSGGGSAGSSAGTAETTEIVEELETLLSMPGVVTFVLCILAVAIVIWIIGGAVELGHNRYYITLVLENRKEDVGVLFSRFGIFGKAFLLRLYIGIKVFLWTLLLIVPGIIAAYRYILAPYLMAENPSLGVKEAVEQSKALMKGHKWRYFCLGLSFIGWAMLSALTLGIGSLWLNPYMCAANAAFYIDRTGRNIPFAGQQP